MAIEFKLPEVSEGVKTADVSDVLVSEGDVITAGQVVLEVETEKAVAPVECPVAGRVSKIHVKPGQSIPIGATLLTIEETSDAKAPAGGGRKPPEKAEGANGEKVAAPKGGDPAAGPAPDPYGAVPGPGVAPKPQPSHGKTGAPPTVPRFSFGDENEDHNGRPPVPAAPSVRRLARELGVDLYQVKGSGRGGRVTAEDVRAYAEGGEPAGTGIAAPAGPRGGALAPAARGDLAPMAAPQLPDFSQWGPVTRQKMNKLARTSAANLSYAWATIPHVTQHDLADVTELEASRKAFMSGAGAKGPKITMTAIMVKAVVAALKQHPAFNSSIDLGSGEIVLKEYYHIGIAVDTEAGLVVPVIRDADKKTILQIAAELTETANKARDRKLQIGDMQGGTFTITNLGGIGGTSFTPIVNYPEVAILGMSRSQTQLRLEPGGRVAERLMLPLSLSYDHRVINGADAARFISTLSASLSDFMRLLVSA
jgi:pyruvate dehydrogenase E2 component (dihydrolipoamide acetyltransferase)